MWLGLGDRKEKMKKKKKMSRKRSYSEASEYLYNNPDIKTQPKQCLKYCPVQLSPHKLKGLVILLTKFEKSL